MSERGPTARALMLCARLIIEDQAIRVLVLEYDAVLGTVVAPPLYDFSQNIRVTEYAAFLTTTTNKKATNNARDLVPSDS